MSDNSAFEFSGPERDKILVTINSQMTSWGLAFPREMSVVLHFGLNRFMELGVTEYSVADEPDHGYSGTLMFLFDGQRVPTHHHKKKHHTLYVVKGMVRVKMGDDERAMRHGDRVTIPPDTEHSLTGLGNALLLEVSNAALPKDSFFKNKAIGEDGVL